MKVLITGGAGFIGSHIVDACRAAGHTPFVVDDLSSGTRDNLPADVPLYVDDIRDAARVQAIVADVRPDIICHQAAQMSVSRSVREPIFDAQVNVLGLLHVCEAAVRNGVQRIVFASSGGVMYGDVATPAPEETPANPISPYGIAKWVGERYLQFYAREHGLTTVALRYANVYGPRQNPHGEAGVVAIFSQKLLRGEAPTINGDGRYLRDYVYGPDVARANLLAFGLAVPDRFAAFNIGTAITTDVNELAAQVAAEVQRLRPGQPVPPAVHGPARAGDLRANVVAIDKAAKVLGWTPTRQISDGLRETVQWFAQHRA